MTKTSYDKEYAFVYKKAYAMKMIELGHQVFTTMPNPQKSYLMMWVFLKDATFDRDLQLLISEDCRHD